MKVVGYSYADFCRGIAERDGPGCYVKRLLVARRAAVIERWREGAYGDVDRQAGWVPGNLFDCDRRLDGHHVLPKQWLKREFPHGAMLTMAVRGSRVEDGSVEWEEGGLPAGLDRLLNDPRNGILVCRRHHDLLENARIVIARADLPESVEEFAAELGVRAVARLERDYGYREAAA